MCKALPLTQSKEAGNGGDDLDKLETYVALYKAQFPLV